ncbi:MAG: hypothetical protein QM796_21755 [Chthoniobacteraceae bacterium]
MQQLISRVGAYVDAIRINSIERVTRDGTTWLRKQRQPASRVLIPVANRFFRLADNPVQILQGAEWQRWESDCFAWLHGDEGFKAVAEERACVSMEMPGFDLSTLLKQEALELEMLAAAGTELRRAHALPCPLFAGPWSHGDPHLGNFIFERKSRRARLMDFEVRHHLSLGADERHADDLLVFLQDLIGRVTPPSWLPRATAFLRGYDRPPIVAALKTALHLPGGIARIWWAVRTTYMPSHELRRRLEALRQIL